MSRRVGLALLALIVAASAQAQIYRPGSGLVRPGFQFIQAAEDPAVTAWAAGLSPQPSVAERARLSKMVQGLKADGVWAQLDHFNWLAAETQQASLRDLKNPAKSLTVNGTVTFTANRGWQGDGSTGWLDYGETYDASGNLYALNSATVGIWCNAQGPTAGIRAQMGNLTGNPRTAISPRSATGTELVQINDTAGDTLRTSTGTRTGHRAITRTGANAKSGAFNGTITLTSTTVSTNINVTNATLLRSNATFSDDQIAVSYTGGGMPDAGLVSLHTNVATALADKGAQ